MVDGSYPETALGTFLVLLLDDVFSCLVAMISPSDGQFLRSHPNVTVTFPSNPSTKFVPNDATGGLISSFSSWGPNNELTMNPHIALPGGEIFSTFPLVLGGFASLSGTSMATPYATGIVALYLGFKSKACPLRVREQLITTGSPLNFNDGDNATIALKAPVVQQGGGLANAFRFIKSVTEISPGFLELNVYLFEMIFNV